MTPQLLGWTIYLNIFVILQNLFIKLFQFSENDQLELQQHYTKQEAMFLREVLEELDFKHTTL